jgi:putative spermidine/putrescine transport system ATP-binding protein
MPGDDDDAAAVQAPAAGDGAPDIRLVALEKRFGDVAAVDNVDLDVAHGEFFTMLGPSGSGKTTTLRLIAGFEMPDSGRVELGGVDVARRPPFERDVNTVFQDYALFPHMSVLDNVAYGLKIKRVGRSERREKAGEALQMVRLPGVGKRKPLSSPAASASASRSRGRSSTGRACCCSTSRSERST